MNIADAINQDINEFSRLLNSDVFCKNDIEEFLKTNPECAYDYINKIAEYVCEKYKNEISIYLEIAKYYLNKNVKESIKYLEIYKFNGGNNQDALILLMKLYRDTGSINKAMEITESINYNNDKEAIEEVFSICMFLDVNAEGFKSNLESILRCMNTYDKKDKKELLNHMFKAILKKIKIENCDNLILIAVESLKQVNFINRKHIVKRALKCYLNLYIETAKKEFINKAINIAQHSNQDIHILFNNALQLKIKDLNIHNPEEKKQNMLKILKNNCSMITDFNKFQAVDFVLSCHTEDVVEKVKILCEFIDNVDSFDWKLSRGLAFVLRKGHLSIQKKNKIIQMLKKYYKNKNNIKYKNMFLNEIEILEKKVVLKSKPRSLMVSLTTKCNLKCIMCNVIDHKSKQFYSMDTKFYNFIVANMPYLEEVIWQGGEVFLYDKFKSLSSLAYTYNVRQNIITNALLLNKDLIDMINKYRINLQVSIDAVDKKTYEKIRFGAKYENLLEKLEILKNLRYKNKRFEYNMQAVVISENYEQLEDLVRFAIFYSFDRIAFLNYIAVEKDDLCLSQKQRSQVFNKIIYLKNKYKNISIETNIELQSNEEKLLKNNEINIGLKSNEDKVPANNENLEQKKIKDSRVCRIVCLKETELHKSNLFCMSPWTRIYLDFKRYIRITCLSNQIDVKKYKYDEIWNCPELVDYRKKITLNDFSDCNSLCKSNCEYGENITLGFF